MTLPFLVVAWLANISIMSTLRQPACVPEKADTAPSHAQVSPRM
jgi:hypothetical protein